MGALPQSVPYCSIGVQYSGAPGSALAQVSSVESKSDLVIDSPLANEGDGWRGSGANPWHLDDETDSILFLTNMGQEPARIGFQVHAGGVDYHLTKLRLNAYETRAIDLRKLRDAQKPDFFGNRIPAGATDGNVVWIRVDNVPVAGRVLVVQRHKSLASSCECGICSCPLSFLTFAGTPDVFTLLLTQNVAFTGTGNYADCNYNTYYYDITQSSAWNSSNMSVVQPHSGRAWQGDAVGGGSATYTGSVTGTAYYGTYCTPRQVPGSHSAPGNVKIPAYLERTGASPDSLQCSGSNFFARRLKVFYQVVDSNLAPVTVAGMSVSEQLSWSGGACQTSDGCGQKPTPSSWTTDANGKLTQPDTLFNCSATCTHGGSCTENWQQTFTVNGSPVGVTDGSIRGGSNCISTDCSNTPQGAIH
jgi:hypothetical protein